MRLKFWIKKIGILIFPLGLMANATYYAPTNYSTPTDQEWYCENRVCTSRNFLFRKHHYTRFGDEETKDPTYRLEDDTAWPSEREDFSDLLFR